MPVHDISSYQSKTHQNQISVSAPKVEETLFLTFVQYYYQITKCSPELHPCLTYCIFDTTPKIFYIYIYFSVYLGMTCKSDESPTLQ